MYLTCIVDVSLYFYSWFPKNGIQRSSKEQRKFPVPGSLGGLGGGEFLYRVFGSLLNKGISIEQTVLI